MQTPALLEEASKSADKNPDGLVNNKTNAESIKITVKIAFIFSIYAYPYAEMLEKADL